MSFAQISTSVSIINSGLIGYFGVSLTEFNTTSLSSIASGSGIEIAGAFFKADADVTPNASSWTAITTGNSAYLTLTPSGTAGSQILSAAWTSTAPEWSTSKQGWYTSAGSAVRVVAEVIKQGASVAYPKVMLDKVNSLDPHGRITLTSGTSWTVLNGIHGALVTTIGGGGAGAGSASNYGSGGGGASGYVNKTYMTLVPGTSISYSVGAGGVGGSGDGPTGGDTTFSGATTSYGGIGGASGIDMEGGTFGGDAGGNGFKNGTGAACGGKGGGPGGGRGGRMNGGVGGGAGQAPGGGGGGAGYNGTTVGSGGNGAAGVIYIDY